MKKQVVYISGGEVFDTRDDFKQWLASDDSNWMLPTPGKEPMVFWSGKLEESLGGEYDFMKISMPLSSHARYDEWKIWFEKHIQFMNDEVILLGWSLGATFLFKYLVDNNFPKTIESLHLVAGRYGELKSFEYDNINELNSDIGQVHIYHSKDDEIVPFEDANKYKKDVSGSVVHVFEGRGHFLQEEFPELINEIKK